MRFFAISQLFYEPRTCFYTVFAKKIFFLEKKFFFWFLPLNSGCHLWTGNRGRDYLWLQPQWETLSRIDKQNYIPNAHSVVIACGSDRVGHFTSDYSSLVFSVERKKPKRCGQRSVWAKEWRLAVTRLQNISSGSKYVSDRNHHVIHDLFKLIFRFEGTKTIKF